MATNGSNGSNGASQSASNTADLPDPEGNKRGVTKTRPGLKKGQKHAGSFKKGYDPRRGIRHLDLGKLAREHTEEALATIVGIMLKGDTADRDRLSAASIVLDRGYGRAAQFIQMDVNQQSQKPELMSLQQLEAKAADIIAEYEVVEGA